jgi:hypothetical protein
MYTTQYLKNLKKKIEYLDTYHHLKILSILKNNNIGFSENKNGIFVNMNSFTENIIKDINNFIKYVEQQEKNLKKVETLKYSYKKDYFDKEDKEIQSYNQ